MKKNLNFFVLENQNFNQKFQNLLTEKMDMKLQNINQQIENFNINHDKKLEKNHQKVHILHTEHVENFEKNFEKKF